jgi:hypothetical protein
MATTLKTKNSVVTTVVPTALAQGELAVNITDKKMWVGNAATTPIQILGAGVTNDAGGSNTQVQYNSSGVLAGSANMTFSGTALTLANDASISGLTVGKGASAGATNSAFGVSALAANTGDSTLAAFGYQSLKANTSGSNNAAFGANSAASNTTGYGNTAVGSASLNLNTTGLYNTAVGLLALYSNTTASNNTAVGYQASYSSTTGTNNTVMGYQAGYSGTFSYYTTIGYQAGYSNTDASGGGVYVGWKAGYSTTSGTSNTAVGVNALTSNTTADNNTAVGTASMAANTTGTACAALGTQSLRFNTTGNYNTAVGLGSLYSNTTASSNTAVGYQALLSNTTGEQSVAVGANALDSQTTGAYNTTVGYDSLSTLTTGQVNTCIGYGSGAAITTSNGNTFIGAAAGSGVTTGANNSVLGRYNGNQGGLDIRTASDNIVLSDGGGNPRYYFEAASGDWFLNQITAGYYCLMRYKNQTGAYFAVGTQSGASPNFQIYNPSGGGVYLGYSASSWTGVSDERLKNITGEISNGLNKVNQLRAVEFTWKRDETNESQVGLIAQDVQAVLPQAIGENDGYLGVRYTEVIPLLVAAIKELKAEFDAYKATHP